MLPLQNGASPKKKKRERGNTPSFHTKLSKSFNKPTLAVGCVAVLKNFTSPAQCD